MDISMIDRLSSCELQLSSPSVEVHISNYKRVDNVVDTSLTLDFPSHRLTKTSDSSHSESNLTHSAEAFNDGCSLFLGLGPSTGCYPEEYYSVGVVKNKGAIEFSESDNDSEILTLGLSTQSVEIPVLKGNSVSLQHEHYPVSLQNQCLVKESIPIVDEGSTSSKRNSGGYMPNLLFAPSLENIILQKSPGHFELHVGACQFQSSPEPSAATDFSAGAMSGTVTSVASFDIHCHHPKRCRYDGCLKGARGASGLCIAHGGGQRCQKPGCNKGAESRTAFCKAHGGGKRCQQLGCTKSAEGKTDYCIAHGGGRRCEHQGCSKAARGKSGLCIRHGGGKRCRVEGCNRSAEGHIGLCISHGGGRRCKHPGCTKGAQGSTLHCKAHGGGRRCMFAGCTKGAEGSTPLCKGHGGGKRCLYDGGGICPKSVHGGTDYCVAHGGGKRCIVPGCTKSARGRTDCCVRHGGGKRCQYENCGKSAQGSTDFCKAHGGGKRCTWGHGECDKFARGKSGLCAAHGNLVQDRCTGKQTVTIDTSLFHGVVPTSTVRSTSDNNSVEISCNSYCDQSSANASARMFMPPQMLVPPSMNSSLISRSMRSEEEEVGSREGGDNIRYALPEGRVHGGMLMSLLSGDLNLQYN